MSIVKFKSPISPLGGPIQTDDIAPRMSPVTLRSAPAYGEEDWVYTNTRLIPEYIPATEAIFSKTMYRGLYIKNTGTTRVENLRVWLSGGESFHVKNSPSYPRILHEGTQFLSNSVVDYEKYRYGGASRSSLFGQVKAALFIGPEKELVEFNEDGFSEGINLRFLQFVDSPEKITIPNLEAGDYHGVYLRFTTNFSPYLGADSDYCFLHASWTDMEGRRYSYPGQVKDESSIILTGLPSVSFKFSTDFSRINKYFNYDVKELYNRYPPFFLRHEDVEDDG
jgi:hypothetical protein